jgi:glycosyltransferase involved in cell wall biosynthesis
LDIVEEVAKHHTVITAGQGECRVKGAQHLGVVRGDVKANLLARAKALICPTTYIEPFGGVAVEAQLSGTPVICTDFGAFTETVKQNYSGFRCRNLRELLQAADDVKNLDSLAIQSRAQYKFSLRNVAPQWKRWYDQLQSLHGEGWYAM